VVSHAGHNTVCEALAHGLPLVVAPIRDDQPIIAGQVEAAGAGVRVRFGRVTAAGLRVAIDRVLSDPDLRAAAARLQASFAAAGGAPAAAAHLEQLAAGAAARGPRDTAATAEEAGWT
jgi:UDP:flavonoid glycosyltransferase YjiC (YdhE family)